jgi:hypothetical protein
MAGAGFKTFAVGDVLTSADVNTYLMQQSVMVFDSDAARSTALGANVSEGMVSYVKDVDKVQYYTGANWLDVDVQILDRSVYCFQNATTTLTQNTWVALAFQTERFDTNAMHDNSTNNSRITLQSDGKYIVGGTLTTNLNNAVTGVRVLLNGSTVVASNAAGNSAITGEPRSIATFYNFVGADYIELQGFSASAGATSSGAATTSFWAVKVA